MSDHEDELAESLRDPETQEERLCRLRKSELRDFHAENRRERLHQARLRYLHASQQERLDAEAQSKTDQ